MPDRPRVRVLAFDPEQDKSFGPSQIELRTAQAGFGTLGVSFQDFPDGGYTDPWTTHYEEAVFVAAGVASILVVHDGGEDEVRATAGEIVAIPHGATVKYGGEPGTRLLLAFAPVNWREHDRHD